ncbi:MAG: hypothetical protein RLO21_00500 [Nitratireductor sp.]
MVKSANIEQSDVREKRVSRTDSGQITRRNALLMIIGSASVPLCWRTYQSVSGLYDPLPHLERQLVRDIEDYEWWNEVAGSLDAGTANHLVAHIDTDDAMAEASSAWERHLATEGQIATTTATDMRGLMVQAQTLASRYRLGFYDEYHLVNAIIRGLEILRPLDDYPSTGDDLIFIACQNWNAAIDEEEAADRASDEVKISYWATNHPEFVSDPIRRAAIEAEQRRTGWRAALERLWAALDQLETAEENIAQMTASSFIALLAIAHLLARRIAPTTARSVVTGKIGMALVRGLERLGGRRTRDLHQWWGTEADDPPVPTE